MNSPQVACLLATPQSQISIRSNRNVSRPVVSTPKSTTSTSTVDTIERWARSSAFGKYGGYYSLFGGFLIQLTMGSWYCFGNLVPYIASYMTYNVNLEHHGALRDEQLESIYHSYVAQSNIVLFVLVLAYSVLTVLGGHLENLFGPTKTLVLASFCLTFGFGFTYLGLLWNSMTAIAITYGLIFGSGVGIGYPVQPVVCMRWFPTKMGLVNGVINAVFGAGPFVFDVIQSKLVNPENAPIHPRFGYSKNYDILQRIPFMFAYVAAIMLSMQFISIITVKSPPWFITVNKNSNENAAKMSKSQLRFEASSLTVRQSMRFLPFWELWLNNFLFTVALMWLTAQWKIVANTQIGIQDDQFLGIVGALSALSNGLGRFLWGVFYDWSQSFRVSMALQTAICAAFIMTLPFIASFGGNIEAVFAVWMIIIWFCAGCDYAFLPSCIAETFGAKHVGAIIGVFVMAEPPAMLIVVLLTSVKWLQDSFVYSCGIVALCCVLSTALSVMYRSNRVDRTSYLKQSMTNMKKYGAAQNV